MGKTKIFTVDDTELIFALAHFDEKELEVIERFNDMLGKVINKKKLTQSQSSQQPKRATAQALRNKTYRPKKGGG